jgi:hypothetical protein
MDVLSSNPIGWPQPIVLDTLIRRWEPDPADFIGIQILPDKDQWSNQIRWDALSGTTGLTNAHNLNADPQIVNFKKLDTFSVETAFWKEMYRVTEKDLLEIRQAGTIDQLAGERLILEHCRVADTRVESLKEWARWQCLLGSLSIQQPGQTVERTIPYGVQTVNASLDWSSPSTATPLTDIQTWCLLFLGKASGNAKMYINLQTANYLCQNQQIQNLVRQSMLAVDVGLDNIGNLIMKLTGCLEEVVIYKGGYHDINLTYYTFIPDSTAILIARPPKAQVLGNFKQTPSLHNGGYKQPKPGKFIFVHDESNKPNPHVDIVSGVYGLPVLYFPEAVVAATTHP